MQLNKSLSIAQEGSDSANEQKAPECHASEDGHHVPQAKTVSQACKHCGQVF